MRQSNLDRLSFASNWADAKKPHMATGICSHLTGSQQNTSSISDLQATTPIRTRWKYSNWGYGLCAWLIQVVSGNTWAGFLEKHVFRPLGMRRTFTSEVTGAGNMANAYMCLNNRDASKLPWPESGDGKILERAIGMRSCISDLMVYYRGFVSAAASASLSEPSSSSGVFGRPSFYAGRAYNPVF